MEIYVYTRYFLPDLNYIMSEGTKKAIHGLCSGLAACGVNVTLLCEGDSDFTHLMPQGYLIRCFLQRKQQRTLRLPKALRNFINQNLNEHTPIILNGIFQPKIYSLSRFLHKLNVPYVYAPHDPYHSSIFSKNSYLKWPYWFLCEQKLLQQASAIQVLDPSHEIYLRDLRIKAPVVAVPNGFSEDDILDEELLCWSNGSPPKLFFLGRLDAHNKGLDLLLRAFAEVVQKNLAELTLQGVDKGDKAFLEKLAKDLGLEEKVTFLEPDYKASASSLIRAYDIFCLPSRFEGFGLSALEAMLCARVLLISEIAGISSYIRDSECGVVIEPSISSIKEGLISLIAKRNQWQEMGFSGRRYAIENLSWKKIASDLLEQYRSLAIIN